MSDSHRNPEELMADPTPEAGSALLSVVLVLGDIICCFLIFSFINSTPEAYFCSTIVAVLDYIWVSFGKYGN